MQRLKSSRKPIKKLVMAAVLAVILAGAGSWYLLGRHASVPSTVSKTAKTQTKSTPKINNSTISLLATGDWIAHDSVNAAAKQADGTYDYLPQIADFQPIFKQTDIRFCNDPILNGGAVSSVAGYPKFNSPPDFVTDMGKLGCNLANTASNHSFDRTQAEITASVTAWSNVPNTLAVAGENSSQAQHDAVSYFTVKGVKFAFLAYTTYINTDAPVQNSYGVNVFSKDFAGQQIAEAKQNGAQFIIASMRWGTEYSTAVDATQTADAQWLADEGVNLVLGHGSHELEPVTQLTGSGGNKTVVWYSLGNFLNTQEPAETLFNGVGVMDIDIKTKAVTIKGWLPIYMHYEWTAAQAAADDTNARTNLHMYLLDDATQAMIDSQRLKTSVAAQRTRMITSLNADGLKIPLITKNDL
jgi:poly-gamma-glutamate synthesis protein (capsule biosynthesis protein)